MSALIPGQRKRASAKIGHTPGQCFGCSRNKSLSLSSGLPRSLLRLLFLHAAGTALSSVSQTGRFERDAVCKVCQRRRYQLSVQLRHCVIENKFLEFFLVFRNLSTSRTKSTSRTLVEQSHLACGGGRVFHPGAQHVHRGGAGLGSLEAGQGVVFTARPRCVSLGPALETAR